MDEQSSLDVPSSSDPDASLSRPSTTTLQYTHTVSMAVELLEGSGFSRSRRDIQRKCAGGALECEKFSTPRGTEDWLINEESIHRYIKRLKQTRILFPDQSRPDAPMRDESRQGANERDQSRSGGDDELEELKQKYERLKTDYENERVLRKGREFQVNEMKKEQVVMIEQVTAYSRRVGQLETQLQLAAPSPQETDVKPEREVTGSPVTEESPPPYHDGENIQTPDYGV